MRMKWVLLGILTVWALGAVFLRLGGTIHFLLVVALIVAIVDRVGRTG